MNWLIWRQYRKTFMIFGILLLAIAAFIIPTSVHYWHAYQHALANAKFCRVANTCPPFDSQVFAGHASLVRHLVLAAGILVPLLLGLFLGSPLIAKEYADGTNNLAWTQSISRRKWLVTKLVWALGFALLYGIILTLLTTWWSRTSNVVYADKFSSNQFDIQGLMPVAASLLFTGVGFMFGAWFRKTLPALGVTIGVFIALQIAFPNYIQPYYMTPVTVTAGMSPNAINDKIPQDSLIISINVVAKNGKIVTNNLFPEAPLRCQKMIQLGGVPPNGTTKGPGPSTQIITCLNKAGFHQVAEYQPAYRYWDFQRIEFGIYLGLTALVTAVTYGLVLRRDA